MRRLKKRQRSEIHLHYRDLIRIYAQIQAMIDECPDRVSDMLVSEFAAKYRHLPQGTPYPGPWRNERTPYLVDIMDDLSARSHIREVIFAKSAQVGATAGPIENFVGYVIKCVPGPILFTTADQNLLGKWVNKRLDPLLVSCKLDKKIDKQFKIEGGRGTGNQKFSKEFPGGSLDMVTANSAAGLRSDSIRYLIMDEVDGYRWDISGEGDPLAIAEARCKAWKKRKKMLFVSTPTTTAESHIWPMYESGDQRKFFVPCPHCWEEQTLEFGDENTTHGIKWETTAGRLDPDLIYYHCINCEEPIYEHHKYTMVQDGVWRPTAKSSSNYRRSYHINAIYSLMEDWESIVQKFLDAKDDPQKMRAHVNLSLGLPYREQGTRPSIEKVIELRGDYKEETVPDGVLFLTAAVDVQLGSMHGKDNVPRLEMEICGHGFGYKTWSITYKIFEGEVMDPYGGAWEDMFQWALANNHGLDFYRSDGFAFQPRLVFIDASDGKVESVVFEFCTRWQNCFPIKGYGDLKQTKNAADELLDEARPRDIDRFRVNRKDDMTYYLISTNWYKKKLYRYLKVPRRDGDMQLNGFCDFPKEYPRKYFEQLTSEELREDGSFWCATSTRNEALDVRVYNLCAQDIWLASELRKAREAAVKAGQSKRESEFIHTRHVLEYLIKTTARRKPTLV
jgi:phage terminase large subunit GpA-like protein